jgi:hypothetical protein
MDLKATNQVKKYFSDIYFILLSWQL